ncbi:DUF3800 domain-containing protein [Mesorhizobium sp. 10J20-29]
MLNELLADESAQTIGESVRSAGDTFLAHREGIVVVIEVYLDETGTDHASQIIGVSAVWATKEDWSAWTIDWIKAKAPIRIHHSVDCHGRHGEWEGWSKPDRDKYVLRILPVIRNHYIRGIVAAVDKREINRILSEDHGIKLDPQELVRGYYYVCLQWAIRSSWSELDKAGHRNIAFVHETNDFGARAFEAFRQSERHFPDSDAQFGTGSKLKFPPLQCADLLAYEGNHQMRDFQKPLRKPLEAIDPTGRRFSFRKYDKSEVGQLAEFTANFVKRLSAEMG